MSNVTGILSLVRPSTLDWQDLNIVSSDSMMGFILVTLLACAHGMGDFNSFEHEGFTAAYGGILGGSPFFGSQTSGPWDTGVCLSGKKQSPINVDTRAATVQAVDPGMPRFLGHEVPRLFTPVATPYALTIHPSVRPIGAAATAPSQPIMLSEGPFGQTRTYVALSIFTVKQMLSTFLPKYIFFSFSSVQQ